MNTTILIIGIVLVAAFVIPMAIINNHGKSKKLKDKKLIEDIGQVHNLIISSSSIFHHMILAHDNTNHKLAYIVNGNATIIDLLSTTNARIEKSYQEANQKLIDKIHLVINTKKDTISILFYDNELRNKLDLHEQNDNANEWLQRIETSRTSRVKEPALA